MNIQSLLKHWQESFAMFTKKGERKLYALGTLLTFKRALTIIVKKFWWLLLISFNLKSIVLLLAPKTITPWIAYTLIETITATIITHLILLATRPSLEAKNFSYFFKYAPFIWPIALLYFIGSPLLSLFVCLVPFFFLDSTRSLTSFGLAISRTCNMIAYCLPLCALLTALTSLSWLCSSILLSITIWPTQLSTFSDMIPSALLLFIFAIIHFFILLLTYSATSVLYTKLKHKFYILLFGRES